MSNDMRHLHWLLGGIMALVATAALAGEITLYEHPGFQGRNMTTGDAVPNLARAGFNDMASSIVVRSGLWEVCSDAYFHGNCATLRPGEYRRIDSTLNDRISSARQVGYESVPPGAVVTSPPVAVVTSPPVAVVTPPPVAVVTPPEDTRIVLHERTRSGVKSVELTNGVRDLDSIGFSDRADSATVYGGVWRLCDREGGNGTTCVEFGPGYYDHLGALDRNVRSALVVGEARAAVAVPAVPPRVVLYEFPDFAGRSLAIENSEARDLMWQRFAARAGSIRVFGGSWMFCTGPNFSGECRTLGPGEYPRLGPDLDRRIASARLVSNVSLGLR
jgi:Beta/Gamma crystallin